MLNTFTILGVDLYTILFSLGLIGALIMLRVCFDKRNVPAKVQNFYLIISLVTLIVGVYSSILFQAFFNAFQTGKFEINDNTGMTFYGGFIGGVLTFLLLYFVGGKLIFKDSIHRKYFSLVADIAPICICIGHAFGRFGCLCAGCCHGKPSEHGIYMLTADMGAGKFIPTQLYEAIFLLVLFAVCCRLFHKQKNVNFIVYTISYGIWRFFIEFVRGDERGEFIVKFLTPSQAISICLLVVGITLIIIRLKGDKRNGTKNI